MKLALNLAAVLLLAVAAVPASAQRGGASPGGAGLRAGGGLDVSMRGTVDSGRVLSRGDMRIDPGDNHHARRRWNAAHGDTGTRIRRPGHHQARRRWNAANGNDRQAN